MLALGVAVEGCAQAGPPQRAASDTFHSIITGSLPSCPIAQPGTLVAFDSTHVSRLVGEFMFTMVDTSWRPPGGEYASSQAQLTLAIADSLQRARSRERRIGHAPRANLQLVGTLRSTSGRAWVEPVEVDNNVLISGCRDCTDASPTFFRVTHVSSAGFAGTWRDFQTGIGIRVGPAGTLPDPAGIFCARRDAP